MRHLLIVAVVMVVCFPAVCVAEDTPAAAATRKKLAQKISVKFKNDRLSDVVEDLKEEVKGLRISIDTKGGVSRNQRVTYEGKDVTVEEVLNGICKKASLSWSIISRKADAYDGFIKLRRKD
jgi:hypothetical protein